jgi:hypothetical protein
MAAKKKDPIPPWFNPNWKQEVKNLYVPQKMLKPQTEISRVLIEEWEELPLKPGAKYRLEYDHELDWGGCYYPGESPSIKSVVYLVEFSSDEVPNPHYKSQKKVYDEEVARINSWDSWKAIWNTEQARKKEIAERRKLYELKKKYEKS